MCSNGFVGETICLYSGFWRKPVVVAEQSASLLVYKDRDEPLDEAGLQHVCILHDKELPNLYHQE